MKNSNSIAISLVIIAVVIAMAFSGFYVGKAENQFMTVENQLSLIPNIETMGVVLSGTGLPQTADLMYQQSGEATWHPGHPLTRIDDGRLVGSLFELSAATSYNVKSHA